jgi:hypothetical protein
MILAQAQAPQLPALPEGPSLDRVRGPIALPTFETWQIALALLFILLVLGLVLWTFLRNRRKQGTQLPPYDCALRELDAAIQLTEGDDKRFATLTSAALRRYLEAELGLHFTARTSEEFLRSLKGNTRLNGQFQEKLSEVLNTVDRVKFARSPMARQDRIRLSAAIRELIDQAQATATREGREE